MSHLEQAFSDSRQARMGGLSAEGVDNNRLAQLSDAQLTSKSARTSRRKAAPSPLQRVQVPRPSDAGEGNILTDRLDTSPFPAPPKETSLSSNVSGASHLAAPVQAATSEEYHNSASSAQNSELESQSGDKPSGLVQRGNSESTIASSYRPSAHSQTRNISAPILLSRPSGPSQAVAPSSMTVSALQQAESWSSVRKSSIDSAISSIFSQSPSSRKSSQDSGASNLGDIASLSSAAGSPEAAIQYLLREKQASAVQNAQLWRLVDKQRAMILGLNKDLERALRDKEKYRKKLKEYLAGGSSTQQSGDRELSSSALQSTDNKATGGGSIECQQKQLHAGAIEEEDAHESNGANEVIYAAHGPTPPASPEGSKSKPARSERSIMIPNATTTQITAEPLSPDDSETTSNPRALSPEEPSPTSQKGDGLLQRRGFDPKRPAPLLQNTVAPPSFAVSEPSPDMQGVQSSPPVSRKPPPSPLHLKPLHPFGADDHSDSEYDNDSEVDELRNMERGRRRTREDDERVREVVALQEQERRSRSKKEKSAGSTGKTKGGASGQRKTSASASKGPSTLSSSHESQVVPLSSVPRNLEQERADNTAHPKRVLLLSPMTPGLPMSPRPTDRPLNSPAPRLPRDTSGLASLASPLLSPRTGFPGLPMSPRVGKQFPLPSPGLPRVGAQTLPLPPHRPSPLNTSKSSGVQSPNSTTVYRGLASDQYPELLLPPGALSSIMVKVSSPRLKPSRLSCEPGKFKPSEQEAVLTLAVFMRSSGVELWRIETDVVSLPHLDHDIKKNSEFSTSLPDRALFSGHAPAKVDARRAALDHYFDALLGTHLNEKTAIIVCQFLSKNAISPRGESASSTESYRNELPSPHDSEVKFTKEGYLTKRGKNFGGWKARFFVLDDSMLRYYESPGGHHLGTIKLKNARIGKQSQQQSDHSPTRMQENDNENDYRHAFVILEPKKKDSSSLVRHVLCADSDEERDDWVVALLQHVEDSCSEDERPDTAKSSERQRIKDAFDHRKKSSMDKDSLRSDRDGDALLGMSYEDTIPADVPTRGVPSQQELETSNAAHMNSSAQLPHISGPTNGAVIQDVQAWGNKPRPLNLAEKKEQRKRSIWGFKNWSSPESNTHTQPSPTHSSTSSNQTNNPHNGATARAIFGVPLGDAAEYSQPEGIEVYLPAVVYRCLEYLDAKDAASEEGIFRLSGSNLVIKALRERFNTEGDVNLLSNETYYDIHAVASLLKLYLRELPSSVLTRELHLDFVHVIGECSLSRKSGIVLIITELDNKAKKVEALRVLVHRLPRANYSLLRALSAYLITIVDNSDINRMTVRNGKPPAKGMETSG